MKGLQIALVAILAGVLLFVCVAFSSVADTYNQLKSADQGVKRQWGQVENQLQRRFDLVPALVSSVRGIFDQEEDLITKVTEARKQYGGTVNAPLDQRVEAAQQYQTALSRLLVVIEQYPEVRSNERVADLMAQIEGTENRIATERGRYNDEVGKYNAIVVRFPSNIIASVFGFKELPYFKAEEGSQEAPSVNLED